MHGLDILRLSLDEYFQTKSSRQLHLGGTGGVEEHFVGGAVVGIGGKDFLQIIKHAHRIAGCFGFQLHHGNAGGIQQLLFSRVRKNGSPAQSFTAFKEGRNFFENRQQELNGVAGVLHFHGRCSFFKQTAVGGREIGDGGDGFRHGWEWEMKQWGNREDYLNQDGSCNKLFFV